MKLTYKELLRRLVGTNRLSRGERDIATALLASPDDQELAEGLVRVLESLVRRGELLRVGAPDETGAGRRRYLDLLTNDRWAVDLPRPRPLSRPAAAEPAPPTTAPRPSAIEGSIRRPKLVEPIRDVDVPPGLPARFHDESSGEPLSTLFASFAPTRDPRTLATALAPLREIVLARTSASDVRVFLARDADGTLAPVPEALGAAGDAGAPGATGAAGLAGAAAKEPPPAAPVPLGGRTQDLVLGDGRTLHVPDLALVPEEDTATGALVSLPLRSGGRTLGLAEVTRDEPGAFDDDEIALFRLAALALAGLLHRAEILETLVSLDGTTGLGNRAHFGREIEKEIERANRTGSSVALVRVDLDRFGKLVAELGSPERWMGHVASALRANVRQIDVTARWDERGFAILLPSTNRHRAEQTAERIRRVIAGCRLPDPAIHRTGGSDSARSESAGEDDPAAPPGSAPAQRPSDSRISVSVGLALYPDDAGTARQLVERADRVALPSARRSGRNRVVSWASARDSNESLRPD